MATVKKSIEKVGRFYRSYTNLIIILLAFVVSAVIPAAIQTKAASCAYVAVVMSVFWMTEALPLAVTALLPVVMYPLLGIMPSEKVAIEYFRDIVMLFFGSILVATTIEITKLHERLALMVLMRFGSNPKWVLLGFMIVTSFLSLWISNTATTSMMLPIVNEVVRKMIKYDKTFHSENNGGSTKEIDIAGTDLKNTLETVVHSNEIMNGNIEINEVDEHEEDDLNNPLYRNEKARRLQAGCLIGLTYSASMGGMGSLVGTSPNIIIKGYFDEHFPNAGLDFLTFLLFALPVSIIMVALIWIWLAVFWLPREYVFTCKKIEFVSDDGKSLSDVVKNNYKKLGPIKWEEKCVGVIFLFLVVLWITRDLQAIPGWAYFFKKHYPTDTTPAILGSILLFVCPRQNIFKGHPYNHLIEWKTFQNLFPWSVLLLLGGSLALAQGFQVSGLSDWIGDELKQIQLDSREITLIIVVIITSITTEFASNASVEAIFLPIVDRLAKESKINAIYLLLPMTLSTSMAFMFPVSSPNNAIVFSGGQLKVKDMIISGVVVKIIGLMVIFMGSNIWLSLVFDLDYYKIYPNLNLNTTTSLINSTSAAFI